MKHKHLKSLALCAGFVPVLASAQATIQVETQPTHKFDDALHIDLHVTPSDNTDGQPADLWVYLTTEAGDNIYVTPTGSCTDASTDCTVGPFTAGENIAEGTIDIDETLAPGNAGIPLGEGVAGKYSVHAVFTAPGTTPSDNNLLSTVGSAFTDVTAEKTDQPNLVIFLADDLGYNDIAPFGGEMTTPTLDTMAAEGTLLTNFHSHASCSPTRSITLSGVDNHRNGLGTMDGKLLPQTIKNATNQYGFTEAVPEDIEIIDNTINADGEANNPKFTETKNIGRDGYEGHLNQRVVTIATVLRDAGYHTYMIGKWHLGENKGFRPYYRGFEKTFALLEGAGSNFDHIGFSPNFPYTHYTQQGELAELPSKEEVAVTRAAADALVGYADKYQVSEVFYSTRDYTDFMINNIEADRQADAERKPFFAHFAYQAPHAPLQAPVDLTEKYLPIYQAGWDVLRQQRFDQMVADGIIPAGLELPARWNHTKKDANGNDVLVVPAWDDLNANEQAVYAKKMAIYAGMIEYMDFNIQRFMDYLKSTGEYENTIFLFFGDNGADDQDRDMQKRYTDWYPTIGITNCLQADLDSPEDITQKDCYKGMGLPKSLLTMPPGWAQVSATPHFAAKATMAEGGLRASAIIMGANILKNVKSDAFMSALDVFPTFLDYAHVKHPIKKNVAPGTLVAYKDATPNPSFAYNAEGERFIFPLDGRSFRAVFSGAADKAYGEKDGIGFELYGTINRALFMGDWKILKLGDAPWGQGEAQEWALYNLKDDPRELNDVSAANPDIYAEMIQKYNEYASNVRYTPHLATQQNQRSRED
ncbi:sulfatase-like hydrolase/transferase [Candidatus Albibeggiatoa sp. nov. BB20]|uniref:sulfatase-like hydrolase/transferase n=1 Tax=Candidatus Albibeggiatoa sp. nov. BB20 TaxID=3162723 RepID=UPI0033656221